MTATAAERANLGQRLLRRSAATASGCVEWAGARNAQGYGMIGFGGHAMLYAHRAAWLVAHGELPPGALVLHSCDNPPCVLVEHLRLGSAKDNMDDAQERGRGWQPTGLGAAKKGTANANARLDWGVVRSIRARVVAGETRAAVARDVGVSRQTVSDIVAGKLWREEEVAQAVTGVTFDAATGSER